MKWKLVVLGGALVGTFTLGAMFSPIGQPEAGINEGTPAMIQTVTNGNTSQQLNDSDICPVSGQEMGSGAGMGYHFAGSLSTVIAEAFNISVEELQTARSEGKSVADLAKEKNVSLDELKTKVLEARKSELQQLVSDGSITQEQMDDMLVNMESRIASALENNGFGFNHGHMNGRGGMGNGHMNRGNMSFY
ncbi:DUF2680 domain-containing protein [Niallia sp. Krafla_26]|uniref:DUF2680 domain-containing protein n=1 Tax=Niallia sp. Krafla_26 TaxID=3064703 RepID=UPI003D1792B0